MGIAFDVFKGLFSADTLTTSIDMSIESSWKYSLIVRYDHCRSCLGFAQRSLGMSFEASSRLFGRVLLASGMVKETL